MEDENGEKRLSIAVPGGGRIQSKSIPHFRQAKEGFSVVNLISHEM